MSRVIPIHVVRYLCREVQRQDDEAIFVEGMMNAWFYAFSVNPADITMQNLQVLNALVKRRPAMNHFRMENVTISSRGPLGAPIGSRFQDVPRHLHVLLEAQGSYDGTDFAKAYLDIHPELDGNGRTASLLMNIKDGTLKDPRDLPYFTWPEPVGMGYKAEGPHEDLEG